MSACSLAFSRSSSSATASSARTRQGTQATPSLQRFSSSRSFKRATTAVEGTFVVYEWVGTRLRVSKRRTVLTLILLLVSVVVVVIDRGGYSNQAPVFPPPKLAQTGLVRSFVRALVCRSVPQSDVVLAVGQHPDAVAKHAHSIRDLLLVGDRNAAVDAAVRAQMWPEAMLIASFTGKDEYKVR